MVAISPRAHRRVSPAFIRVAQIQARVSRLRVSRLRVSHLRQAAILDGESILLPSGQILSAPPESLEIPSTSTSASLELTDFPLDAQIAHIDAAYFLQLNIDADVDERDTLRAQIAQWQAEELDAYQCGQSCDYSAEIEAAQAKIAVIDERLFCHDLCAELHA